MVIWYLGTPYRHCNVKLWQICNFSSRAWSTMSNVRYLYVQITSLKMLKYRYLKGHTVNIFITSLITNYQNLFLKSKEWMVHIFCIKKISSQFFLHMKQLIKSYFHKSGGTSWHFELAEDNLQGKHHDKWITLLEVSEAFIRREGAAAILDGIER